MTFNIQEKIIKHLLYSILIHLLIVFIVLFSLNNKAFSQNSAGLTSIIADNKGNRIGQMNMFSDGENNSLSFNKNQKLYLTDVKGNYIAGYKAWAFEPTKRKLRNRYYYFYKKKGKEEYLKLRQFYTEGEFRNGFLLLKGTDSDMTVMMPITRDYSEELTKVNFISLKKKELSKTKTRVTLVISLDNKNGKEIETSFWEKITGKFSIKCDEFSFEVEAKYPGHYYLSDDDGDFAKCLGIL